MPEAASASTVSHKQETLSSADGSEPEASDVAEEGVCTCPFLPVFVLACCDLTARHIQVLIPRILAFASQDAAAHVDGKPAGLTEDKEVIGHQTKLAISFVDCSIPSFVLGARAHARTWVRLIYEYAVPALLQPPGTKEGTSAGADEPQYLCMELKVRHRHVWVVIWSGSELVHLIQRKAAMSYLLMPHAR